MPVTGNAFSEYRNVIVTFNGNEGVDIVGETPQVAMGLDAYKAAIKKVEEIEAQYAADPTSVSDLADVTVVMTGTSRYKLHSFQLTLTIATGVYVFIFNETVPNAESLS